MLKSGESGKRTSMCLVRLSVKKHQNTFLRQLEKPRPGDWSLMCGSLAQNVDADFLIAASQIVHERSARLVLDIPKIKAETIARRRPALIKPNVEELYAMFDETPDCGVSPQCLIDRLLE